MSDAIEVPPAFATAMNEIFAIRIVRNGFEPLRRALLDLRLAVGEMEKLPDDELLRLLDPREPGSVGADLTELQLDAIEIQSWYLDIFDATHRLMEVIKQRAG